MPELPKQSDIPALTCDKPDIISINTAVLIVAICLAVELVRVGFETTRSSVVSSLASAALSQLFFITSSDAGYNPRVSSTDTDTRIESDEVVAAICAKPPLLDERDSHPDNPRCA